MYAWEWDYWAIYNMLLNFIRYSQVVSGLVVPHGMPTAVQKKKIDCIIIIVPKFFSLPRTRSY